MKNLSFPTNEAVVRVEPLGPHFTKYHLNNGQVLHCLLEAEPNAPYHNHPWPFVSNVLHGWYTEEVLRLTDDGEVRTEQFIRRAGTSHRVEADTVHRITALPAGPVWTLITPEPWEQEWGFFEFRDSGVWYRQHNQSEFWLKIPVIRFSA